MTKKPAFWISVGLTVFTVLIFGGVFAAMAAGGSQTASQPAQATDQISPELAQLIAERELAYTQLIDQANQQLAQAQAAMGTPQPGAQDAPAGSTMPISQEQATQLAVDAALSGAQLSGTAELVDYEGSVAYEVPFDLGNIYVDASTGDLLYNGTISLQPSPISPEQAAQIAAAYMGNNNVYRVDIGEMNGATVYRVKFTNSDAVFVDQYGQILLVRLASSGSASTSSSSGEHEGEGDHDD